jgi:hypothetical protein
LDAAENDDSSADNGTGSAASNDAIAKRLDRIIELLEAQRQPQAALDWLRDNPGETGSSYAGNCGKFPSFQPETVPVEVKKPSPKLQAALDWLRDNPGDMTESTRAVADKISAATGEKISHAWVGKAKRIIEDN